MQDELNFEKVWFLFQETDKKFKETDKKILQTNEYLKDFTRRFGELMNRFGDFVELMFEPGMVRVFREWGIDVHEVHRRVEVNRGKETMEIDLLVVDDNEVVAVECKSRFVLKDIKYHLTKLSKLKKMMPVYAGHRLYGAIAGIVIEPRVVEFAEEQGLFVVTQKGDNIQILNRADFRPKEF